MGVLRNRKMKSVVLFAAALALALYSTSAEHVRSDSIVPELEEVQAASSSATASSSAASGKGMCSTWANTHKPKTAAACKMCVATTAAQSGKTAITQQLCDDTSKKGHGYCSKYG